MPRYFFHVLNNKAIFDTEGVELKDLDAVRKMAIRTAGEILESEGEEFWNDGNWRMSVADEAGDICFTLDFNAKSRD